MPRSMRRSSRSQKPGLGSKAVASLAQLRTVAVTGHRPHATYRDDVTTMAIAFWPITAMFFDGRNHDNHVGQETFFTRTPSARYAGLTARGLWRGLVIARYRAIPEGYRVAVIGLCILAVGGPSDLAWHTRYGFEVNVDAIYSPPHLMLFFGGLLVS